MNTYKRYITYDLNFADTDDYQDLYSLLDKYNAHKITESTYEIETNDDWQTFKSKFIKATKTGDNIKAIVFAKSSMTVWSIR